MERRGPCYKYLVESIPKWEQVYQSPTTNILAACHASSQFWWLQGTVFSSKQTKESGSEPYEA